jgi:4-hydroxy-tetrahydrodipicolinate synthase
MALREEFRDLKDRISGGILPATVTPWTPDPEYDLVEDDLQQHVRSLTAIDGIEALVCNAHSGECKMLDPGTKQDVIRAHVEAAGNTPVFAGVSGESSLQAVERATEAEAAGADALMLLPLEVYSNADARTSVEHFRRVADAVDIPLVNFQFPTWGSAGIPIESHVEICSMPEVIAFKEASFDPVRAERTIRAVDDVREDFTLMTGNDTFLYHAYLLGSETGLIAYANLIPEMHVEKVRAVREGDLDRARELRREMLPLTNFVFGEPQGRYLARTKAALQMLGTYEYDTILPPQQHIGDDERAKLRGILEELGEL